MVFPSVRANVDGDWSVGGGGGGRGSRGTHAGYWAMHASVVHANANTNTLQLGV